MDFISKLSKPLRNVQSFAIKHWKYIFVMFVLIAYIIHALFRKEGMMEYMDTSESGKPAGIKKFAGKASNQIVKNKKNIRENKERLDDMEEKLKNLAMSSGDGVRMDDLNGQVGSVEETNVMQANSSASTAEEARLAEEAAAKLEVLKQAMDSAKALHVKKVKLFNDTPKRKETARDRIEKDKVEAKDKLDAATTAYNTAEAEFKKMYPEYSQ